jgi:hypothetical protein
VQGLGPMGVGYFSAKSYQSLLHDFPRADCGQKPWQ